MMFLKLSTQQTYIHTLSVTHIVSSHIMALRKQHEKSRKTMRHQSNVLADNVSAQVADRMSPVIESKKGSCHEPTVRGRDCATHHFHR